MRREPGLRPLPLPAFMLLGVQSVFVLVALALQRPSGPVLLNDESSYMAIAAHLSTRDAAVDLVGNPYYSPGMSLLMTPLLSSSSIDPWTSGLVVNIAAYLVLGPVLYGLARRAVGASVRVAVAAAAAGCTIPALGVNLTRVWPEVLLATLAATWALLVYLHLERGRLSTSLGLAALTTALWITHHRTAAMVAVTVVVLAAVPAHAASRRRSGERRSEEDGRSGQHDETGQYDETGEPMPGWIRAAAVGAVGLAALGIGVWIVASFEADLRDRLFGGAAVTAESENVLPRILTEGSLKKVLGHLWSTQIVTLGLAGVAVLSALTPQFAARTRLWMAAVTVGFGGTLLVSTGFLATGGRVDTFVYERYIGIFFPVLVTIGVAAFVQVGAGRERLARVSSVLTGVVFLAMITALGTAVFRSGSVVFLTIPTLTAWDLLGGDRSTTGTTVLDVGVITVAVVLVALLLVQIWRWRPLLAAMALPLGYLTLLVAAAHFTFGPFYNAYETTADPAADLFAAEQLEAYGVAVGTRTEVRNSVAYSSGYLPTVPVDEQTCPPVRFFIAMPDFDPDYDAKRVRDLPPFGGTVWETSCRPEGS